VRVRDSAPDRTLVEQQGLDRRGGDLTQLLCGHLATETELWCVTDSKFLTVITEDRLDVKRKQYDEALANGGGFLIDPDSWLRRYSLGRSRFITLRLYLTEII
jgi:hypothetical protein